MTNEQLAEIIQQGGADDLKPIFYERVKHLMFKICGQYFAKYSERFSACGVELSDIRQECYPAFLKAIESFKPAENLLFTSYLKFHIVNACAKLLGIRNAERVNRKPLDNCTSLDKPVNGADGSEMALGEIILDTHSQDLFEQALNNIYSHLI